MLYAVKTWALAERLASCDHRMLRRMSRIRWQDRITNEDVRRRCGVKKLEHKLRKTRLRLFGHVKHRDKNSLLRRVMELDVEDRRPIGRLNKTLSKVVKEDMRKLNIMEEMAVDKNSGGNSCPTPGV